MNLLSNALKFTAEGHVALNVCRRNDSQGNPHLVFAISDSGIGISDQALTQLFESFAQSAAQRLGRTFPPLSGAQLSHLLSHDWPGNVRELANVAERQVLGLDEPVQGIDPGQSLAAQQEAFEAQCLRAALTRHKGDVKAVLEELQLPRRTFNEKMQRHGLTREMFVPE